MMNTIQRFVGFFRRKPLTPPADVVALLTALPDDQATRNALGRWIGEIEARVREPLSVEDFHFLIGRYRAGGISIDRWRIQLKHEPGAQAEGG